MNLSHYVLSACIHNKDARVYATTHIKGSYFHTDTLQYLYAYILTEYAEGDVVTEYTFADQAQIKGMTPLEASSIFGAYNASNSDWQPNLRLFVDKALEAKSMRDISILDSIRADKGVSAMYERMQAMINEHHTGVEKPYYSAIEIDKLPAEDYEVVRTGVPALDQQVFSGGEHALGRMVGILAREKHGKTRFMVWNLCNAVQMGERVLYVALEGRKQEIRRKIAEMLGEELYTKHRHQIFIADGLHEWEQVEHTIVSAIIGEGVGIVMVDYLQLIQIKGMGKYETYDRVTQNLQHLMIRYNVLIYLASQLSKKEKALSKEENGYRYFPTVNDAYGTGEIIKASSILLGLFRPKFYMDLMNPDGSIIGIDGSPITSDTMYLSPLMSREENSYVSNVLRLSDHKTGFKVGRWNNENF